jgi:hypothetical protein
VHWGDDQALSIRRHREQGVGIDFKQVQHASVDHEGQTIAVLCQALDHSDPPSGGFML